MGEFSVTDDLKNILDRLDEIRAEMGRMMICVISCDPHDPISRSEINKTKHMFGIEVERAVRHNLISLGCIDSGLL